MNKLTKVIFLVIGLAVFIYLITEFGFDNILANVSKTGWWFLPIIGVWAFVYLLNAVAWYLILGEGKKNISFLKVLNVTISGFAINYVTPFVNLGGEPYRVLVLKDYVGMHRAVSSVILYTMLHFLSHFLFWITAIIMAAFFMTLSQPLKISLIIVFIVLIAFTFFVFSRHKNGIFHAIFSLLRKIKFLKSLEKKLLKKEESLLKIDDQIKDLFNNRKNAFYWTLFLEYFARTVASLEFYFIFRAVGMEISFFEAFYISAASSLIIQMFFFMPFELGTREGSLYLVVDSLKLTAGIGIYIGIVNRLREFFWILIGLILIQFTGKKKSGKNIFEYMSEDTQKIKN